MEVICGADGNPFPLAFREGIELLSVGGADWSLQYRLQLISPHFHPILAFQILIGSLANDSVNEKKEKGAENVLVTFVELVNCGDHR